LELLLVLLTILPGVEQGRRRRFRGVGKLNEVEFKVKDLVDIFDENFPF